MKCLQLVLLVAVLCYTEGGRQRYGKISNRFSRQINHRDYRALPTNIATAPVVINQDVGEASLQQDQNNQDSQARSAQPVPQPQGINRNPISFGNSIQPQQSGGFGQQAVHPFQAQQIPTQQQNQAQFQGQILQSVLSQQPQHSQLIGFRQVGGQTAPAPSVLNSYQPSVLQPGPVVGPVPVPSPVSAPIQSGPRYPPGSLLSKLPDNSTLIRPDIVEGFSCAGRKYGYYADQLNGCQIFHVCFPLRDVFKGDATVPDVTYQFSFICNSYTMFSQDSMTCAWTYEAVPCDQAHLLYDITNGEFFKIPPKNPAPAGPVPSAGPVPTVVGGGAYPVPAMG